jgi:ribosomal protein L10
MKTTLYLDEELRERLDEDAARYKIARNKLIMMIVASHYGGAEAKAFFDAMNLLSPTLDCPENV